MCVTDPDRLISILQRFFNFSKNSNDVEKNFFVASNSMTSHVIQKSQNVQQKSVCKRKYNTCTLMLIIKRNLIVILILSYLAFVHGYITWKHSQSGRNIKSTDLINYRQQSPSVLTHRVRFKISLNPNHNTNEKKTPNSCNK